MNSSTLVAIVAVLVLLAGGAWYYSTMQPVPAPETDTTVNINDASETGGDTGDTTTDANEGGGVDVGVDVSAGSSPTSAAVTLGANGFSPKSVTIKKGGTITWSNQGGGGMWVASAQHPTHTAYSGTTLQAHCDDATDTSFDQCKNGSTYSFKFDKVGTWNYHNHSNASQFGSVVVVE